MSDDEEAGPSPASTHTLGTPEVEDDDELGAGPSDWVKVNKDLRSSSISGEDAGSETEPDSDNEDVNDLEVPLDDDDETWSHVDPENTSPDLNDKVSLKHFQVSHILTSSCRWMRMKQKCAYSQILLL